MPTLPLNQPDEANALNVAQAQRLVANVHIFEQLLTASREASATCEDDVRQTLAVLLPTASSVAAVTNAVMVCAENYARAMAVLYCQARTQPPAPDGNGSGDGAAGRSSRMGA